MHKEEVCLFTCYTSKIETLDPSFIAARCQHWFRKEKIKATNSVSHKMSENSPRYHICYAVRELWVHQIFMLINCHHFNRIYLNVDAGSQ